MIGVGSVTKLNFLSLFDYEQSLGEKRDSGYVVIDYTKQSSAQFANYILEIDAFVECEEGLIERDWLLIRMEDDPVKLEGKTVALLTRENNRTVVGLRTFFQAEDHYFLAAKDPSGTSTIVINYQPGGHPGLEDYYSEFPSVEKKFAYQVRVIGEVIDHFESLLLAQLPDGVVKRFIRQVPVVSQITDGRVTPIPWKVIEGYQYHLGLHGDFGRGVFGVKVEDNSMSGDGINSGDLVFIRQQPDFSNGELVAVTILTPNDEPVDTLKRGYVYSEGNPHWFFQSSNPQANSLVVIPLGSHSERIRAMYLKAGISNIQIYENAEISISGKLVGLVRKDKTGKNIFFEYADGRLSQVTF